MQAISNSLFREGKSIGFVPTMGFLHDGHISLVQNSVKQNDITVVSIFVNPTQFGPNEDLSKYPRDFAKDEKLLLDAGVDFLFYPEVSEIYPDGYETFVVQEKISTLLEGKFRPIHFRGVTTIVTILFNAVKPNKAYFGQKDAQQCAVLNRMVKDLAIDLEMVVCPIKREDDGLAMSSRNVYLSKEERQDALVLSRSLKYAAGLIKNGESSASLIKQKAISLYSEVKTASLDYLEIVDYNSFESVEELISGGEYFILVACRIGKTRLIDNLLIKV